MVNYAQMKTGFKHQFKFKWDAASESHCKTKPNQAKTNRANQNKIEANNLYMYTYTFKFIANKVAFRPLLDTYMYDIAHRTQATMCVCTVLCVYISQSASLCQNIMRLMWKDT